jgi:hypothetical protein
MKTHPNATWLARTLLGCALLGLCLSPGAAEKLPQPVANAASALRSVFGDAARPATNAASAVRQAVDTAPKPAALAASAASAVKSALEPMLLPGAESAPAPRAATVPLATPAPPAAACLRPSDQVAACQPGQQLSLAPIVLPTARLGVVYKPRRMVSGGVAPYRVDVVDGSKPEGLEFTPDGSLGGRPIGAVRTHSFTVQVTDSSAPPLSVRQAYTLRVEQPAPPRPAANVASAAPVVVPQPPAAAASPVGPAQVTSYMLLQEELDDMFPKPKPAEGAASAPAPVAAAASAPRQRARARLAAIPTAHADKMQAMLAPLVHVDFPTARLFAEALEASRCAYFRSLVTQAAKLAKLTASPADLKCEAAAVPAAATGASAPAPATGVPGISPTLYAELLPEVVKRDLTELAQWHHPIDGRATPPAWADNGCGCAPPIADDWSYGIYPFWQGLDETPQTQGQDATPQKIDFSLFSRIGYLGAQLSDTGALVTAMPLTSANAGFTRKARRFGTQVDLIVHRSEWADLLNQPYQTEIIQRAVKDIVARADTPLTDPFTRLKRYLLPGWDEPVHMFDGVTLFFDNAPTDPQGQKKFEAFYTSFMHSLISEMQTTRRPYALSIVAPATEIGKPGAYDFSHIWDYLQRAQKLTEANALVGGQESDYKGTTDITISVLALLAEPTSQAKKDLRASADKSDAIHGHSRVAVLNAIAPVLFHAAGKKGLAGMRINEQQFDDDLAYFKWQFGGMGLWPMPLHDTDTGPSVYKRLAENFSPKHPGPIDGVCQWVCPNRTAMRLLFMGLLVTGAVALGLYHWACSVRRLGRPYLAFLWLGGVVTVAVGLLLLSCDPQLANVRRGNGPLIALLVVTVATGMYYSLRPRIAPP